MNSAQQKTICLAAGGAAAAALVWLRYARSAEKARSFLGEASRRVSRTLEDLQSSVASLRNCAAELDQFAHQLVEAGNEQKARAEAVLNDTLKRFDYTAEVIQKNVTQSSHDITAMLRDLRTAVAQSVASKPSRAA